MEAKYLQYIELLSRQDPSLLRVLRYISEAPPQSPGSFHETFFRGSIIYKDDAGTRIERLGGAWDHDLDPLDTLHRLATADGIGAILVTC